MYIYIYIYILYVYIYIFFFLGLKVPNGFVATSRDQPQLARRLYRDLTIISPTIASNKAVHFTLWQYMF